jgi:hypothetical protein
MSVLECWNLDIRQAIIRKAAPIVKGTGKIEVDINELDSVPAALLFDVFAGE